MVEIKPGAELDLAVAEACGVKGWIESVRYEVTGYESPKRFVLSSTVETVFWEPSIDLNAAFYAAEKVGLFSESYRGICKEPSDDTWGVVDVLSNCERVISSEDTASLAICAAILELVKGND